MRVSDLFILAGLLALLSSGIWLLWINLPGDDVFFKAYTANISVGNGIYSEGVQFYPNMRYKDREISYWVDDVCSSSKKSAIFDALAILADRTLLSFVKRDENSEIKYLCSKTAPKAEYEKHYVAGEGGPVEIINASVYFVILSGEVALYRNEKCDKPQIALHETLHALGFDHNNNPNSIMFPITDCNQEFDDYIVNEINNLYKVESLPDLVIESIKANKSRRLSKEYLNFEIIVGNFGLEDVEEALLNVYSGNNVIGEYNLQDIDIGVRRVLSVGGLELPRTREKIKFIVELKDGKELSEENNKIELHVI